jgi:hypothetical protein
VGASGKKLRGGGARKKVNSPAATPALGFGAPPHPLRVLAGQRYAPLHARRKRPFTITRGPRGDRVSAVKDDGQRERIELRTGRLLAADSDGRGEHYRFIAYTPGRRYRTYAYVAAIRGELAVLVLPDWHPRRPARMARRLLPPAARGEGAWLTCTADLGQPQAGRLNIAPLLACATPRPEICHRPRLATEQPPPAPPVAELPLLGPGCGDIVVELTDPAPLEPRDGVVSLFVALHVSPPRGARAYLALGGTSTIERYVEVLNIERTPNGTRVLCEPTQHSLARAIPLDHGCLSGHWRWRWWPRQLEVDETSSAPLEAYRYEPELHTDDYPWIHRIPAARPPTG